MISRLSPHGRSDADARLVLLVRSRILVEGRRRVCHTDNVQCATGSLLLSDVGVSSDVLDVLTRSGSLLGLPDEPATAFENMWCPSRFFFQALSSIVMQETHLVGSCLHWVERLAVGMLAAMSSEPPNDGATQPRRLRCMRAPLLPRPSLQLA